MKDSDKFDQKPAKIEKYENVISTDPETGKEDYTVKVWYQTDDKKRQVYSFTKPHDEDGKYTLGQEDSKKEQGKLES